MWIRAGAISCVSMIAVGLSAPLSLRYGGIFNLSPFCSTKSEMVNHWSAMMQSPTSYGNSITPDLSVISRSLIAPVYSWDAKQTASVGEIPMKPLSVFLCF